MTELSVAKWVEHPRFPPSLWNFHEATVNGRYRTNNKGASGNNAFNHLVSFKNPSLGTVIRNVETENHMVKMDLRRTMLPKKRVKKSIKQYQPKLKDVK